MAAVVAACQPASAPRVTPTPTSVLSANLAARLGALPTAPPPPPSTPRPFSTLPPLPTLPPEPTTTPTSTPRADAIEEFVGQLAPVWGWWDPRQITSLAVDPRRRRLVATAQAAPGLTDDEAPQLVQLTRGDFIIETRVVDQVCTMAGLVARDVAGNYAIVAYQRDEGYAMLTGIVEQRRRFLLDFPYVGQGLALRMVRVGRLVRAEISTDRQYWRGIGQGELPLGDEVLVGLALWPACNESHVAFDYFRLASP